MRRYTRDEVKAILLIDEVAREQGLYKEGEGIFELYEEFCHSSYNIPYREIEICVKSWLAFRSGGEERWT